MTCVSGAAAPPRGRRLASLHRRIADGEAFTATLGGARVVVGDDILIVREPGRAGLPAMPLEPGEPKVWDGRFEITVDRFGLTVCGLAGRMARLGRDDRAAVMVLPPAVRPTLPVLIGDDPARPVLAWRAAEVRCLVPRRFRLAMGHVSHEGGIDTLPDGENAPFDLCLPSRPADAAPALESEA